MPIRRLDALLRRPETLRDRALSASMWNVIGLGLRYPLRLIGNLIMVRLLAPEAFGLMATVGAFHIGLMLLSDVGITQSVMRSEKGEEPRFLGAVWVVQILRGVLITGILFAAALVIWLLGPEFAAPESVYADPLLPLLLVFSSLALLARGAQSTAVLLARRRMRLGRVMAVELGGQVVGLIVTVALGLLIQNVWALVIGMVMREVASLILSHRIVPGPAMRWVWDPAEKRALWQFGRWMVIAAIGGFFATYSDRLILGGLIDKTLFGIYAIAMVWIEIGVQLLQRIGQSIFIPSFAQIMRERPQRTDGALRRANLLFGGLVVAVYLGMTLIGGLLIDLLYPEIYAPAKAFIPLLAFRLLLIGFLPMRQFIVAQGDSRYVALVQTVAGISAAAAVYVAFTPFGLHGAILAFAVATLPSGLLILAYPGMLKRTGWGPLIMALAYPVFVWGAASLLI
ncbi:MAG: oligosaccharide flippase family protein [Pseudomonadota bacterium]